MHFIVIGNTSFLEPQVLPKVETINSSKETEVLMSKVFYLDLPVTPTRYIGTLIGRNGIHLKKLCEDYDIVNVHLGEENARQGRSRKLVQTSFIYTSPIKVMYQYHLTNERGHLFEIAFTKRASSVKVKQEKHYQMVRFTILVQ